MKRIDFINYLPYPQTSMHYDYVFPSPFVSEEPQKKPKSKGATKNTLAIVIGSVGTLLIATTFFYMLGTQRGESVEKVSPTPALLGVNSKSENSSSATPTPTKKPTPTLTQEEKLLNLKTKIIKATPALDGYRTSSGRGNAETEIKVGRTNEFIVRGFVSFPLSELPQGADISEATLKLYQTRLDGDPFTASGKLYLDHLTYGNTLDDTDYGLPALTLNLTSLSSVKTSGYKEIDVTDGVKDDLANARSRTQFRLHFETELRGDTAEGDVVFFESAENALKSGNPPQLVVTYF